MVRFDLRIQWPSSFRVQRLPHYVMKDVHLQVIPLLHRHKNPVQDNPGRGLPHAGFEELHHAV